MPQLEGGRGGGNPGGGGGGGGIKPSGHAASFGLITSTGGIAGFIGLLMFPVLLSNGSSQFSTFDIDNFDTEEDCHYESRQEDVAIGRNVTVHKVLVVYKNLGVANFTVDVEAFVREDNGRSEGSFVRNKLGPIKMKIGSKKADNKIRTKFAYINVVGERPQVIIDRQKNSGPLCIISATPVGTMVEGEQL